ncbi:hypothetical protein CEE82_12475, partial [Lactobacillus crispatus]
PPLVAHPLEPDPLRVRREFRIAAPPEGVAIRGHRFAHLGRAVLLQPGAGLCAEFLEVSHGAFPVKFDELDSTLDLRSRRIQYASRPRHALASLLTLRDRVYRRDGVTVERQEETGMQLKLLSPSEMNAAQKETYGESIAGKRGA